MRTLVFCLIMASLPSLGQVRVSPAVNSLTEQLLSDATARGYFADLVRQGGFGHWKTERAAFLVRDEDGRYRCIAWPSDGRLYRQEFRGSIPDHTVAIIHTHPSELPIPSAGDARTAIKLSMPIFVLTPMNIFMVNEAGVSVPVFEHRWWPPDAQSTRCSAPESHVPPRR